MNRPQIHFTPEKNWINDPNGLIYYKGVYHLFFQHNPSGDQWGNISWGHASSTDLIAWEEQPVAIPQGPNEYIFSGSTLIDWNNTSGFGTAENPPMIAAYTSAFHDDPVYGNRQTSSIADSLDDGYTWTKYENNPVVDRGRNDYRDPKVFWYGDQETGHWVMATVEADNSALILHRSDNLRDWTYSSTFKTGTLPGYWECPDLFPIELDGDPENIKWVMTVSAAADKQSYVVGEFDGVTFTEDPAPQWPVPEGDLLYGFDEGNYEGWTVVTDPTSAANGPFADAPATGALDRQNSVGGFVGNGLINSYYGTDKPIGSMSSPKFTIDSSYSNFLVGCGSHAHAQDTGSGLAPAGSNVVFDFEVNAGESLAGYGWTGTGGMTPTDQPSTPRTNDLVPAGTTGKHYLSTFFVPGGDDAKGTLRARQERAHGKLACLGCI